MHCHKKYSDLLGVAIASSRRTFMVTIETEPLKTLNMVIRTSAVDGTEKRKENK